MAQSKGSPASKNQTGNGLEKTSVIAGGTSIKGNFQTSESLRIDGEVEGEIHSEKKLVVGKTGRVSGKIFATSLSILGCVEGDIDVKGELLLGSTAKVDGNISAINLIIEEGALFNGNCSVKKSS